MQDVSAVIVTYNSEKVIENCLKKMNYLKNIYVVDNASKDKTTELIENKFPQVTLIKLEKNIGFGPGNNVALKKIKTKYSLIINPDAEIDQSNLNILIEKFSQYKNLGVVGPMLINENGDLQNNFKRNVFIRENSKDINQNPEGDISCECLSGALMLASSKALKDINYFDERIFLFYEDDDLCLALRRNGYDIIYTTDSTAKHLMGQSSPQTFEIIKFKNKHMIYSRLYLEKKYRNNANSLILAYKEAIKSCLKLMIYGISFNSKKISKYSGQIEGSLTYLFSYIFAGS